MFKTKNKEFLKEKFKMTSDIQRANFNKNLYSLINSATKDLEAVLINTHMPRVRNRDIKNYTDYVSCMESNITQPNAIEKCRKLMTYEGLNKKSLQQAKDNLSACVDKNYRELIKYDDFEMKKFELCIQRFKNETISAFL